MNENGACALTESILPCADSWLTVSHSDILMQEILILQRLATANENFDHIVRYYQAWQQNGT